MCRVSWLIALSTVVTLLFLCAFFATGGVGIALVDDDLYISNVLFVLSAVFMLLTSVAFAITIKVFVHAHPAKVDLQLTELKATSDTSHGAVSEAENVVNWAERLARKVEDTGLNPISKSACLVLVVDSLLVCGACYTIMWGLRKRDHYLRPDHEPLVLADCSLVNGLMSLLTPLLLFGAFFCTGGIWEHLTKGDVKMREVIPFLLKGVRLREYNKQLYWELEDTFYYNIKVVKASHPLWEIDTSGSSCLLWIVIMLSLQLCFTYFFDHAIVEYKYSPRCVRGYDCFLEENISHPLLDSECNNLTDTELHCFRFIEFRHMQDIIGTLSKTFAFYLFLQSVFSNIFTVAKLLLALRRCKWWGMLFVIAGSGTCIVIVVLAAVWDDILVLVDVVSYIQIMYGGLFCLVIGLLVLRGKWRDDIGIPQSHDLNQSKLSDSTMSDISNMQLKGIRKRTPAVNTGTDGLTAEKSTSV